VAVYISSLLLHLSNNVPLVILCHLPTAQVYHGLRKIANYPGLSDAGGNTDVVTRKVWATFLSLIDDLREKDTKVEEGLMLTDGADPFRAVVADVPMVRQEAARREIAATQTGDPPCSGTTSRRVRATRATTASPAPLRRGGLKRTTCTGESAEGAPTTSRKKRARKRRIQTPRPVARTAGPVADASEDDALPPDDGDVLDSGSSPAEGDEPAGVGDDSDETGGADGAPEEAGDHQDVLADIRS